MAERTVLLDATRAVVMVGATGERFSKRLSARAEENQGRVAGPALLDG